MSNEFILYLHQSSYSIICQTFQDRLPLSTGWTLQGLFKWKKGRSRSTRSWGKGCNSNDIWMNIGVRAQSLGVSTKLRQNVAEHYSRDTEVFNQGTNISTPKDRDAGQH